MRSKVPSYDRQGQAGLLPLFRQSFQHAGAQTTAGESIDKVKIFHEEINNAFWTSLMFDKC